MTSTCLYHTPCVSYTDQSNWSTDSRFFFSSVVFFFGVGSTLLPLPVFFAAFLAFFFWTFAWVFTIEGTAPRILSPIGGGPGCSLLAWSMTCSRVSGPLCA